LENNIHVALVAQATQRLRIFKFFSGRNHEYDPIQAHIIGKETLPSLSESFFIVCGLENRRMVMMNEKPIGSIAMTSDKIPKVRDSLSIKKEECWCLYCKRSGHTKVSNLMGRRRC